MLFQKDQLILPLLAILPNPPTRDTVFTTEYSVRTAMEAVYTLLNVDRGVPEVFDSIYDIVNCFVRCTTCLTRRN